MSTSGILIDRAEMDADVLQGYFDLIVEQAPVPVHVVDADFKIANVNRRWLDKLGYESLEVLGRPSTDFLTGESRERALRDVLPLLRRAGSSRSVGKNFETKDGRAVPVLLDAQICGADDAQCHAFAVLWDPDDPTQYAGASATVEALHAIAVIQRKAGRGLVARESSTDANGDDGAGPLVGESGAAEWRGRVLHDFTIREQEVLMGVASGARNKEIAAELGTSVRTVKFHVENIFQKLHVHTRVQATRMAIELGIVPRA